MKILAWSIFLLFLVTWLPLPAGSQEGVKVVPIGETIKPEGGVPGEGVRKKRRPKPAAVVQAGESFMIEFATALSSGITREGESVYFRSTEEVGPANRPVISAGATGQGRVSQVDSNKKKGKLVVELTSIEDIAGNDVPLSGNVEVQGDKGAASIAVGDRFTATVEEKLVARGKPKKVTPPSFSQKANVEVSGKGVKADIKKGQVKGTVQVIVEPPKGLSVENLDSNAIALYRVNNFFLPTEVTSSSVNSKSGDKNGNGVNDLVFDFDAWSFIKNQPRGENTVYFKGKLKDGTPFDGSTKVTIDY